jgi:hypothetical protein
MWQDPLFKSVINEINIAFKVLDLGTNIFIIKCSKIQFPFRNIHINMFLFFVILDLVSKLYALLHVFAFKTSPSFAFLFKSKGKRASKILHGEVPKS